MSLQEKLDAYKQDFLKKVPPAAYEIMRRATADLQNSGILDRAVKVGDPAPDFTLNNQNGQPVALRDQTAIGPVVLSFYRGRW